MKNLSEAYFSEGWFMNKISPLRFLNEGQVIRLYQ
jgi:hypothetical protein